MMDGSSIGGFGTPGAGAGSVGGGSSVPGTPHVAGANIYNQSTIQKSMQQMAEDMMALLVGAGAPVLVPPRDVSNMITTTEIERDAINKLLDNWSESIRENAKRAREADHYHDTVEVYKGGPKSAVEYTAYLVGLSSTERAKELAGGADYVPFATLYAQWMNPPPSGVPADGKYPDPSFVAGCLASSVGIINSAIGADSSTLGIQLSVSPVGDALAGIGPASGLPMDTQAAVAMMAALLYNGGVNKALQDTLVGAAQGGKPLATLDFAMNFAKQVMAIVVKSVESAPNTAPNNMLRLILSSMALNLLYRQAFGGMTDVEMADLLEGGGINDPRVSPEVSEMIGQLVTQIQSFLPKDPAQRSRMIALLSEHVDDKESADSMLETTNLFAAMLNTKGLGADLMG